MIRSFKDRETRRFFYWQRVAVFQGFAIRAVRGLILLDGAEMLGDLAALPSNRLEALRGNRAGQHSIWRRRGNIFRDSLLSSTLYKICSSPSPEDVGFGDGFQDLVQWKHEAARVADILPSALR